MLADSKTYLAYPYCEAISAERRTDNDVRYRLRRIVWAQDLSEKVPQG